MLKNTATFPRGPGFNSQYLHGGSKPSVTPVPRVHHPLLASMGDRNIHGVQAYIQAKHSYIQSNIDKNISSQYNFNRDTTLHKGTSGLCYYHSGKPGASTRLSKVLKNFGEEMIVEIKQSSHSQMEGKKWL